MRAMFGGSKLLSVRPVVANCRWTDCPAEPGATGDNAAGELPPEQPASIASVADAPNAAQSLREIAIQSDYHFLLHWFAPRKVSIVQLVNNGLEGRLQRVLGFKCSNPGDALQSWKPVASLAPYRFEQLMART